MSLTGRLAQRRGFEHPVPQHEPRARSGACMRSWGISGDNAATQEMVDQRAMRQMAQICVTSVPEVSGFVPEISAFCARNQRFWG